MKHLTCSILILAVASGCSLDDPAAPHEVLDTSHSPSSVTVGDTLTLGLGETAVLGQDGALLRFEAVPEDSRCPILEFVMCAVRGVALVELTVVGADGNRARSVLADVPMVTSQIQEDRVGGYLLRLLVVTPERSSFEETDLDYRASIAVLEGP